MRARKWILVLAITVSAVVVARVLGLWVGEQFLSTSTQPEPAPTLIFTEGDLTFGPIADSESIERELRLTNTSDEPISVERFEKSCSCLAIEPAGDFTIQPGETTILRIQLKSAIPSGAKLSDDGLFHETVSLDAVVATPPNVRPVRFSTKVQFTVQPTVQFDPPVASLGVVSHRESVTVTTKLTLLPPITEVRVLPHPEWDVTVRPIGDNVREITATPTKPGAIRVVNDTIQVVPIGADGGERPARRFAVSGEIKTDVVSSPADIALGHVEIGQIREEHIRLTSLTGREFKIVEVDSPTPNIRITPTPNDSSLIRVMIKVAQGGEQTDVLIFHIATNDGHRATVFVPVYYNAK